MTYRPGLDGLRAIAVMSVMLFHIGVPGFQGGHVGVDIFFVLSGFLLTGIILRELDAGRFSLIGFYERRVRRILPALVVLLFVTYLAAAILSPTEFTRIGQTVTAVALFGANFLFLSDGAFFQATLENPLLHLWTLSLEEQFYLILPVALVVLWQRGASWIGAVLIAAALVSLVLALVLTPIQPKPSFFLLHTRAWEFLAGSLAAYWVPRWRLPVGWTAQAVSVGSVIAIAVSIVTLDHRYPVPSLWTLLPVLGAVGVCVFATSQTWVGRALSLSPYVWIGRISYSAYLWHLPMITFAATLAPDRTLSMTTKLGLIAATLFIAWLSWRWVEQPYRNRDLWTRQQVFRHAAIASVVLTLLGLAPVVGRNLLP